MTISAKSIGIINMYIKKIVIGMFVVLLASCSHTPSVGEQIMEHSAESKALGEQWKQGENFAKQGTTLEKEGAALIKSGNKKITKGKKLISSGEKQIQKGNAKLDDSRIKMREGLSLQAESKAEFAEKYPGKLQ